MTMPLTFKTPKPATIFAPLKQLLRPIFFAALGLHLAAMFIPLPQEEKAKVADDKKDPLKVTQVPTAGLTKPLPKPTLAATGAKPVVKTTTVAKTPVATTAGSSALPMVQAGTSTPLPTANTTDLPPGEPSATNTPVEATPASTVNPEEKLFQVLANLPVPDPSDPAATNVALREQFVEPEKFFMPTTDANADPEWRTELKGSPTYAIGDTPEYFYETLFQGELKGVFAEMKKVGEYAGGALYHLKQGSYEVYVSLLPAKMPPDTVGLGTIIAVWAKDPRTP
jgi:hypothetical protein